MASIDISPQELRDIEIREAWRGYHRDDVDELLERAAATIEHLEAENTQLRARLSQGPQAGGAAPAPARAPVVAAAPTPAPAPAPAPIARTPDTDVIQRTLVLAQKAADEAVAEAKARATQIVSESEAKAQHLVGEAEENARRIAETEKGKLEEDIAKLSGTRDTLQADIDALEQFEQEYRQRLHDAIEAELELLSQTAGAVSERPEIHEVELPDTTGPSWSASQGEVPAAPVATAPAPVAPARPSGPATVHIEAVPAYEADEAEPAWDPAPAGGWADATGAVDDGHDDLGLDDGQEHSDSLDDDAFFASLREAVRDEGPLGTAHEDDTAFFDQEDTDEHKRLFRRKR